jgi:hypothetical protein
MDDKGLELLQGLLREQRDNALKANTLLAEVRVGVAGIERSQGELRRDFRELSDRTRGIELELARLPAIEREQGVLGERVTGLAKSHERRHTDLETRVRKLEGDGRVSGVVNGGLGLVARYVIATLIGVIGTVIVTGLKHGASPLLGG